MVKKDKKRSFMSFNSKDWKGFTFRSGSSKSTKQSYSTFWDNQVDDIDVDDFLGLDTDVKKGKDLVALAGYKRAISNFVNIVTEQSIPVVFNNNDESFTDGKKVVWVLTLMIRNLMWLLVWLFTKVLTLNFLILVY